MSFETTTETLTKCHHCGQECTDEISFESHVFCCDGCRTVYRLLNENGLCDYYEISNMPGLTIKGKFASDKFSYLDDEKTARRIITFTDGKQTKVTFYLPQMHCSSCIWLLEHLQRINPDIIRSHVNFTRKEVYITFDSQKTTLRKVVELLSYVGYEPYISLNDLEENKSKNENKAQIYRIGVAGFCFGNIMMLSFPEYFSSGHITESGLKETFSYLNLLLSLPVLLFAASGFFVSAYKGLRQNFLNIDAPIALAIAVTFLRSVYEILSGTGPGYLDSMSGIVFFMLLGRWFQNRTYASVSFDRDYRSYFPLGVTLKTDEGEYNVPAVNLKENDRIVIRNGEIIPADAMLVGGKAMVDYSFVTGESTPVEKNIGELIYAGGRQSGAAIELCVLKPVSQSYLTQLWNNSAFNERDEDKNSFLHPWSRYFTLGLFSIAILTALYWMANDSTKIFPAVTAVLIVACPCALLLSATFTNGNVQRIFGRNKFYIKNARVIEKLNEADTIVFDKTGTLTQRNTQQVVFEGRPLSAEEAGMIASMCSQSNHPLSKAIVTYLNLKEVMPPDAFREVPGKGLEGIACGREVRVGSSDFINDKPLFNEQPNGVFVSIDGKVRCRFIIRNDYRNGLQPMISALKEKFKLMVLSGDNETEKQNLAAMFGADTTLAFRKKPEEKLAFVKDLQLHQKNVLMVADGLNDAGALKQSNTGIAVSDDTNAFSPACDAIIDGSNFTRLNQFIALAKDAKKVIVGSFIISIMYNFVGLYFAVQGTLSPVIAAILMPISSISIVLFTTLGTTLAARFKGL